MALNPVLAIIYSDLSHWLAARTVQNRHCQTINFIAGQYVTAVAVALLLVVFVGLNQYLIGERHSTHNIEARQVVQVDQ